MKIPSLFIGLAAAALGLIYFLVAMLPPSETRGEMHYNEAGKIPVLEKGRVKPLDTLARVSLTILNHRDTYRDAEGKKQPAMRWLLDVMTAQVKPSRNAEKVKAFRIDDPQILAVLELKPTEDGLFAFADFSPKIEALMSEANRARDVKPEKRNDHDKRVLELAIQIGMYLEYAQIETPHKVFRIENDQVLNLLGLERREGLRYSFDEFTPRVSQLVKEADRADKVPPKDQTVYDVKVLELANHLRLYLTLAHREGGTLRLLPPLKGQDDWRDFSQGLQNLQNGVSDPTAMGLVKVVREYAGGKPDQFNREVDAYLKLVQGHVRRDQDTAQFETFFNHFSPFTQCAALYVVVLVLTCIGWVTGWPQVHWAAFALGVVTVAIHTLALAGRMYIQGRPPVTNLYSSAVFIGWGCVLLGLAIEYLYRDGIGNAVAAITGFPTLLIAHYLSLSGDTLEMMQAVLDTNFWLATHVVCVTLGYTATFVAGFLGMLFLIRGLATPTLNSRAVKSLGQMMYGVICFATLLSFTGTVLGGIWADQSWGRFWGWDPKENGALLIVVWNALVLHARWAGLIKQRGMAVLTLVGNMITAWSWFGTNQLGVGLHAYGFNNTLAIGCRWFWLSQMFLIALGLIPTQYWWSFRQAERLLNDGPKPRRRDGRPELAPSA